MAIIGWLYLIVGLITWVIAYGMCYRSERDLFEGSPILLIFISGLVGLLAGVMWPLVIAIFVVHRIATHKVGGDDAET